MSSKDRAPINLVALGSAAVLSVYAAGYARTLPAAQRLAAEDAEERRPPRTVATAAPVTAPVSVPTIVATTPSSPKPTTKAPPKQQQAAPAIKPADTTPAPAAPTTTSPPVAPVQDSAKPIAMAPPPAPVTVDTASKPADNAPIRYKDGTFFGWGTSRHGDIQMGIEIKDGAIKSAFISECNTQYDCSWIYHLPKQVVARQSADVDFVSGATHSANALYRAVVNALKQAQAK